MSDLEEKRALGQVREEVLIGKVLDFLTSNANVEIAPEEMDRAFSKEASTAISQALKRVGFTYVALDLEGYRQGSLNETLPQQKRS